MAPKKKSNKKKEDLEEKIVEEPVIEQAVIKEAVVKEVIIKEVEPPVTLEPEPPVIKESNDSKIDLEVNEILNPILSNDLENLLIKNTDRPKSPIPQRRINKRGATMGMRLGL